MGVVRLLRSPSPTPESSSASSDADFVVAAQGGDRTAQEILFRRHARRCILLGHRLLASSRDDVDDLIQDAFVLAFKNLDTLRDADAFGPWLRAIVIRKAGKRLRHERVLERLGLRQKRPLDVDSISRTRAAFDEVVELKELYVQLEKFPLDERMILVLRRVEGLNLDEIADHLKVSLSTVKRRLRRAEDRMDRVRRRGES